MARTTVRGRSSDVVTTLRVADRTGILAASAPPRAAEPAAAEPAPSVPPSALLAANQGERPAARRIRRNLLLACAAALFLVVGWIGGGVFAQRGGGDTPVVAVGAALDQEQGGTSDTPVPQQTAPAPAPPAVVPPVSVETKQSTEKSSGSSASSGSSRSSASPKSKRVTGSATPKPSEAPNVVERLDVPAKPAPMAMAEELRKMVETWSRSGAQPLAGR